MNLIHFQGLNCYHGCMVTLADAFGLDYTKAFSRLWSEGRLRYDPICGVFLSQRLQDGLEALGMTLAQPRITTGERETEWAGIPAGHYAIIGMDARFIPWSPLYQLLHGPHYFIVQKGEGKSHNCFDPTYGVNGRRLTTQELLADAFALIAVQTSGAAIPLADDAPDPLLVQAQDVLKTHPETLRHFLRQAGVWIQRSEKTALLPAKYVDALLSGRYLYRYFLNGRSKAEKRAPLLFSRQYYDEWLTAKNGFYKAALTRHSGSAFHEACRLLTALFEQERELALQIGSIESQ